jgi:hypothetical protein
LLQAQIKTDKVEARILADLLRLKLVPSVHSVGRESRQIKEVLRQRCFFVRQRTMLRNRIHRLLGAQQEGSCRNVATSSAAGAWVSWTSWSFPRRPDSC